MRQHVEEQRIDPDTAAQLVARSLSERRAIDPAASMWVASEYAQALGYQVRPYTSAQLGWKPLQPVPKGLTNMGPSFALAAQQLAPGRIERRALRPALLLITDGLATDPPGGFETGLSALMAQPAGKAALRLAIAIGRDAQSAALDRFIGDPGVPVLVADSAEDIADRLVAVSLAVSRMSEAGADRGVVARRLFGVPGDVPSKIFDQDTIV
jgi:hypothetical protein